VTVSEQRALIMGLGLFGGGAGAARYLARQGWQVLVTDLRSEEELADGIAQLEGVACEFRLGCHQEADFAAADLVVANPAVPPNNRYLRLAEEGGARIVSELGLFLEAATCRLVLITGTAGKSSSTCFLVNLLQAAGVKCHLGGNLGGSLLGELPNLTSSHIVCLEVSSYQLEALQQKPHPGVELVAITNLGQDHLERHGSLEEYAEAKARILTLAAPGATAVLPTRLRPDPLFGCPLQILDHPGDGPGEKQLTLESGPVSLTNLPPMPDFQRANARLAVLMGHCLGLTTEQLESGLAHLQPPPHRAEELGQRAGVRVVDNGVSTTPEATLAVLAGEPECVTLILGGQAKQDLEFDDLAATCTRRGDRLVLFGQAANSIAQACARAGLDPDCAETFEQAIYGALERTPAGGTMLFSPSCASFDTHKNFKDRADCFRALLPSPDGPTPS